MEIPKKIIWLASYPKSGNTWFRAFLNALLNDGEVNINELRQTNYIYSDRKVFESYTDINSSYLYDNEAKLLQPKVFAEMTKTTSLDILFIKIHDAYDLNIKQSPIVPEEATISAIYIVRNPLDIVPSLANHLNISIENAVRFINNELSCICTQSNNNNLSPQFRQSLKSWSGHVNSWINQYQFPVLVIKYEDMLNTPLHTFSEAVKFMGLNISSEIINKAIQSSSFEKLQQQELKYKFYEAPPNVQFFREGKSGEGVKKLEEAQINSITKCHKNLMSYLNYL